MQTTDIFVLASKKKVVGNTVERVLVNHIPVNKFRTAWYKSSTQLYKSGVKGGEFVAEATQILEGILSTPFVVRREVSEALKEWVKKHGC